MKAKTIKPLEGVRVFDWTHVLAGPYAGFQLAALGAEVIRLESPGSQDIVRNKGLDPALVAQGLGEGYCMLGAGRRCVALDAKDPLSREAIAQLIASADVLLENFRPGKLEALGFAPSELIAQHPNLVVCSISGYPREGARAGDPAYDHVIQAASGLMMANADAQGQPQRVGFPFVDYAVGMHAATAVLAALHRKQAQALSGQARLKGEWLQLSMLETALALLTPTYATQAVSGQAPQRSKSTAYSGSPLSGTFAAAQGHVALVCNTSAQMQRLFQAFMQLGVQTSQLAALQQAAQALDVSAAQMLLGQIFQLHDAQQWEETLSRADVPCARVRTPFEAFSELDAPLQVNAGLGAAARSVRMLGAGFSSSEDLHGDLQAPAPVGMHTSEVLAELGWSTERIEAVLASGAACQYTLENQQS